jgi:zinc protease
MKTASALLFLVLAAPLLRAAPVDVPGFTFVKSTAGISEYTLGANGLGVLLLEDHAAPVATLMVTYKVGSRNEVTGTTGATHLLEHLMFKGSEHFNRENGQGFDTLLDRVGGLNNATTSLDRTNYYEIFPSEHLELAARLEADRMRRLLLRESDRQPEMTVVRNEFERDENDPGSALDKEVGAAAFIAHPYHHPIIGWRSDIEKVSIEKLREFYDAFYWPDNAIVTIIGDFEPAAALRLVQRHFGAIPRAPKPIPAVYTEEPAQSGPRRVVVKRPGETGLVQIAYKVPAALHADHPALTVLAAILGDGKTGRLYRALIDTNLAIAADATKGYFHDATLFNLLAQLAPGVAHAQVEKAFGDEVTKVKAAGVTPAEVERAVNKLLAGFAYHRDGSFAIASQLNEAIAVGDWTHYAMQLPALQAVTAADVQRVAKAYLVEDQSTTGWFVPQAESAGAAAEANARPKQRSAATPFAPNAPHYYRDPAAAPSTLRPRAAQAASAATAAGAPASPAAKLAAGAHRRQVAGLDVISLPTSLKNVVVLRGTLAAGDVFNPPGNSAVADLTAALLDKGTIARDQFAVAELLEQRGATMAFSAGTHTLSFSAKCLRPDLPLVVSLLAEQLRTPRFDPVELAKVKQQLAGAYRQRLEDTDARAAAAFARAVFPTGHPNSPPPDEKYLADLEAATLDQVKAFHAACYGPASARLVAAGDLDDPALDQALRTGFSGWTGGLTLPAAARAAVPATGRTETVALPGKANVSFALGQSSGLRYGEEDYLALNLGTAVLGSGFFSARLLDVVRTREGLTYGITASLGADTYTDGVWMIQAGFAPELLEKGTESVRRELRRFCAAGVTPEELAAFKITLAGSYKVTLSTTEELAGAVLGALERGFGPEWIDDYLVRLQALSLDAVNAAIRKHLDPDRMILVRAGTLPATPTVK